MKHEAKQEVFWSATQQEEFVQAVLDLLKTAETYTDRGRLARMAGPLVFLEWIIKEHNDNQ